VRRIRKLWNDLPNRPNQVLKDLSGHIEKEDNYKAYRDLLNKTLESYRESHGAMVAIP